MHNEPAITPELVKQHGLTPDEYERVLKILGRTPSLTELGIFSVMWSEHCSYKSSRVHLRKLPTEAPWVLQGPGENAGVIDVGDGLAVAFKIESHNHPSYIEPYQGAATGVGGIMRDVFTMGARPIANMNSLRFGSASHPKTAYLLERVVAGIGDYGNCMGVPTVGGETWFDDSYNGNCLVNAFTLGILPADRIFKGVAAGVGNPVLYVGSKTGRDGIHGATMASESFTDGSESKRPQVQVGDPFTEKKLLEACLELMAMDCLIGIQDMGAAGLTSSSCEMAGRAGTGVVIDVDRVPRREPGMTPYEVMLSESQERMLMVVKKGREDEAKAVFEKWDLDAAVIGEVTGDGFLRVVSGGETYAEIPATTIADEAPKYNRPYAEPADLAARQALDLDTIPQPADFNATLLQMIASPNLCSKKWIWQQYDHHVRTSTVSGPGGDAAVLRLPGGSGNRGLGMVLECNSRYVRQDPFEGARIAVAEGCRNLRVAGVEPKAVTDCLNFGNPEKPEVMWTFVRAIEGLADACKAFNAPIISGNVSLYNDTNGQAVFPTPTLGVVGTTEDFTKALPMGFTDEDALIVLVGENTDELGASAYLATVHGKTAGKPPKLDAARELAVQQFVFDWIHKGGLMSAHDVGEGGLAIALAEMVVTSREAPMGCDIGLPWDGRDDALLFGEGQSRIIVTMAPSMQRQFLDEAVAAGVPARVIGKTGGTDFRFNPLIRVPVAALAEAYDGGLAQVLKR
jgi:phosphoribosylformylglycinamidine synthase subunit PurL